LAWGCAFCGIGALSLPFSQMWSLAWWGSHSLELLSLCTMLFAMISAHIERLTQTKHDLMQSNRDLDQFAAVAAHDLRAPLSSIASWTALLEESLPHNGDPALMNILSVVQKNVHHAMSLVDRVLQVARLSGHVDVHQIVDMNQAVADAMGVLATEIREARATLSISSLPVVQGNSTLLNSVLTNLIRNAVVYREKSRALKIEIGCRELDGFYEFYIQDNGIGIKSGYEERIFQMFVRVNSGSTEGTGIGLPFCRRSIEILHGEIWAESEPGNGSRFHFTLPKPVAPAQAAPLTGLTHG
jgi:chemotaxis family two-component system sensor kinase Cph1